MGGPQLLSNLYSARWPDLVSSLRTGRH